MKREGFITVLQIPLFEKQKIKHDLRKLCYKNQNEKCQVKHNTSRHCKIKTSSFMEDVPKVVNSIP